MRTSLSAYQYTLLKKLTDQTRRHGQHYFDWSAAGNFKQGTLRSFGIRGYVEQNGDKFLITQAALEARAEFEAADVLRKAPSDKLSSYFKPPPSLEKKRPKRAGRKKMQPVAIARIRRTA